MVETAFYDIVSVLVSLIFPWARIEIPCGVHFRSALGIVRWIDSAGLGSDVASLSRCLGKILVAILIPWVGMSVVCWVALGEVSLSWVDFSVIFLLLIT